MTEPLPLTQIDQRTARLVAEARQMWAEVDKLHAEAAKRNAEQRLLRSDDPWWLPLALVAGGMLAGAALVAVGAIIRLLLL